MAVGCTLAGHRGSSADGAGYTKNRGGPVLAFGPDAWRRFATQLKSARR